MGGNNQIPSKKQHILDTITQSPRELKPWEISEKTNINRSTVRYYVRRLLETGKILQPYPGSYCSHITHGMIFAPLRTHGVILAADAPWLNFSDELSEFTGGVKVRVQFGLQRHKVTIRISCDPGMSYDALCFAINRGYDVVKERSGFSVDQVQVKTFELNRDVHGVRLDGCSTFTRKGLFGVIERIYQKEESTVRMEQKITPERMDVQQFQALLQGGMTSYDITQAIMMVMKRVESLVDAVKFNNRQSVDNSKAIKDLITFLKDRGRTG